MANPRPKVPAWYLDPDILPGSNRSLRYWNGRHWTDRRRPMPVLASLDIGGPGGLPPARALEGPVHTAELPAPAAEITATRDGPAGLSDTRDRSSSADALGAERSTSTGDGAGIPPEPPHRGGGGGGGNEGDPGGEQRPGVGTRKQKKPWWLYAGVAVLAAVVVGLVGEGIKPASSGPRVVTDAQFVRLANTDCAKALPNLRPPDPGAMGSSITPAQAATQIDQAAGGLDNLANQLAALPDTTADQPFVKSWLAGWHAYAAIGREYATDIREHPPTSAKEPPFLATAADLAKTSDRFSRANGMTSCEWAYTESSSPSDF